jgi:sulfite exporter TauE/SafE
MEIAGYISSAIVLGLLGGFHCLGMCGPLALAIPGSHPIRALIYHSGRTLAYALLGLASGAVASGIAFAGWQQWISIISGILMLVVIWMPNAWLAPLSSGIYKRIAAASGSGGNAVMFSAGFANGFLPCGLVYIAMAGAVSAGSLPGSMLYMFVFGLGTIPLLWALSFAGQMLNLQARARLRAAIPYAASLVAVLLIIRGMNLGIPYISPKTNIETQTVDCCSVKRK